MGKYRTKQRRILLSYLSSHPDQALTARQIAEELAGEGISLSAVYRNLAEMEAAEEIKRLSQCGVREALYQYVATPDCRGSLHLSCKKCGKTLHMDPGEAVEILRRVAQTDQFSIDVGETVLYGVCGSCKGLRQRRPAAASFQPAGPEDRKGKK